MLTYHIRVLGAACLGDKGIVIRLEEVDGVVVSYRKTRAEGETIRETEGTELDLDALMEDLANDEVVRVKELEFEPLTEEEALVKMDLLGHDFFAYTDRDTNVICILYRREEGNYGKIVQA